MTTADTTGQRGPLLDPALRDFVGSGVSIGAAHAGDGVEHQRAQRLVGGGVDVDARGGVERERGVERNQGRLVHGMLLVGSVDRVGRRRRSVRRSLREAGPGVS